MALSHLVYCSCDDWLIFAVDPDTGELWEAVTELWPEWADLPRDADQQPNAVERYMLPHAHDGRFRRADPCDTCRQAIKQNDRGTFTCPCGTEWVRAPRMGSYERVEAERA